ncbi:hypothetical protein ACQEU8_35875 [Streptomyces sp. CA-250714]
MSNQSPQPQPAPQTCNGCGGQNGQHKEIQVVTNDDKNNVVNRSEPCKGG